MKKLLLWIELIALFCALPTLVALRLPRFRLLLLLLAALYAALIMQRQTSKTLWKLNSIKSIILRFLALSVVVAILVAIFDYRDFLSLPLNRPLLWLIIMFAYPVVSALPQEYIFRRFFFSRYNGLMSKNLLFGLNIILFAGIHLIYGNWVSVALSAPGGLLFGRTWLKTKSLLTCTLEHALYGALIFTVGLGKFFYRGP